MTESMNKIFSIKKANYAEFFKITRDYPEYCRGDYQIASAAINEAIRLFNKEYGRKKE